MKILDVELKNFGSFVERKMEFRDGINVLWARNGAGKSTIHSFLCAMLYGLHSEESIRWQSWNGNGCLGGRMRFESGGKIYVLERDFLEGKKRGRLCCETDQCELSMENGDLAALFGNMSENAYRNTFFVGQKEIAIGKELGAELKNYLGNLSSGGSGNIDVNRALENLKRRREELEYEKKQAQVDLISRQQEIRMKMDYVEQDMERLKKEQEDYAENLRFLKASKEGREDEDFSKAQARERREKRQVRSIVGLFIMLAAVFLAVGGIYVPSVWMKVLFFLGAVLLGVTDFLYQRGRSRMLEAEAELSAARESLKKEERRKKAGQLERIRWQLDNSRQSLKEKQMDYQNLKESVDELRDTDSRLDFLEEEIKAIELSMKAIEEITQKIYEESSLKLNSFTTGIMEEIVGEGFGELYLDRDMELCVRTPENTVRLLDESYGTLSQVYFAARMAIGKTLSSKEDMPIILDDTFSMYDSERLLSVFRWLKRSGNQVILFTSRMLEAETARRVEEEVLSKN